MSSFTELSSSLSVQILITGIELHLLQVKIVNDCICMHVMYTGKITGKSILRGYYITNQKLTCFVLYLKIISTFLKNNTCML